MNRCVRCAGDLPALTVFCPNCQHPNEPDFRHLINQTLGNQFQLYRQLGEGGLSTIFAAIDLHTDKTVVVKVSDPRHLTQTSYNSAAERLEARQYWTEMTERMQREVVALTNIYHPNIVRVCTAGAISADLTYVVMELLRGKTLRDELNARGRLPISEAVALATEVAAGLRVIHPRGIVHRDLTPRNIFLCEVEEKSGDGETGRQRDSFTPSPSLPVPPSLHPTLSSIVKLIDFGIAKFPKQAGAQTYTQHAVMAGTPGYASPEQFQNLTVDHRADIYSLGVVLYEMLTGEKPFAGRSATEIAVKQLRDEPVRPRALVPELPMRLEALILRALAKDPAVRQQSAEELVAELKTISARIEVPIFAAVAPIASALEPDPSGSQVFTVLSDLTAHAGTRRPTPPAEKVEAVMIEPLPEKMSQRPPSPNRQRALLVTAGLAFVFVMATWATWIGQKSSPLLTAMTAPGSSATPTPTLRPDITATRTNPRPAPLRPLPTEPDTNLAKALFTPMPTSVPLPKSQPVQATPTPISKPATSTPRPTATPAPMIATTRLPAPPIITPPIKVEPTPSPAPVPSRDETARNTNDGWRREPIRPAPTHPNESVQPRPTATPIHSEPKVISWQGRVYGSREITLEMPGVPGMVAIPRDYRKKVGMVEPPSPSNGWRRTVLRIFGNGEVSLIIRWLPHREGYKQELVQWTRSQ